MNSQHIKSVNTDGRSKNRIKFASSRQRGKRATADVYRSYKRRFGVTSAATREERVHHVDRLEKKQRVEKDSVGDNTVKYAHSDFSDDEQIKSTFSEELDVALDRNASEIFSKFHREIWVLVRSLPELLHHSEKVVGLLLEYMLSPESNPGQKSQLGESEGRSSYVPNHATTDILHLIAVLAKDLRHEMHPFLHGQILPRILVDLISPPPPPPETGKQPIPLDVTIVEAAFRTVSYLFRYDSEMLLAESPEGKEPCLDVIRKYYGFTLGHRRDLVRRLSSESFAPLVRRLPTDQAKRRHLKRVIRALAASGKKTTTPSNEKMQRAAADGIAFFCFEMTRGVAGSVHSKGHFVTRCVIDCLIDEIDGSARSLIENVASIFLGRLCRHLNQKNGQLLLKEISSIILDRLNSLNHFGSLFSVLGILRQIVTFRNGLLMADGWESHQCLSGIIRWLFYPDNYPRLPYESRLKAVELLCAIWRIGWNDEYDHIFEIKDLVNFLLKSHMESEGSLKDLISIFCTHLLPYIPLDDAMEKIGSSLLEAAARCEDPRRALALVHVLATSKFGSNDSAEDNDEILILENAGLCRLNESSRDHLLELFSIDFIQSEMEKQGIELGIYAKCLCFVATVGVMAEQGHTSYMYKKISASLCKILLDLSLSARYQAGGEDAVNVKVAFSMVLECLAKYSLDVVKSIEDDDIVKNTLWKLRCSVESHLLANSFSQFALKSASSFVQILKVFDYVLVDDSNELFSLLLHALRDNCHFRRLHALQILSTFPRKPFVIDYADLDLTGDLDEEPESSRKVTINRGPTGPCNIIEVLLAIEHADVSVANERYISSLISRVEVMARSGKLPIVYAEAATAHMLGLLSVRFAPLWSEVVKALVALSVAYENSVWPYIIEKIEALMRHVPFSGSDAGSTNVSDEPNPFDLLPYINACLEWDTADGKEYSLFANQVFAAREHGRVSRFLTADDSFVFESLWKVVGAAPLLITKHSRAIVPIFLDFLYSQYFAIHQYDPEARELKLEEHVDVPRAKFDKPLNGNVVQKRLVSMLTAFAAINGPEQLYKNSLLFSVFVSFIGHHDVTVSQQAFSCILRFKCDYLIPYADTIKNLFAKKQFRETLLQLKTDFQSGTIDKDKRRRILPLLTRIILGRLSAKTGGKSSKDSPLSRRTAAVHFFSTVCESDEERFPLIYFILRAYIPTTMEILPVEAQTESDRFSLVNKLSEISTNDCIRLPFAVHQGFLNMLESSVSQLGHRLLPYVRAISTILSILLEIYEIKDGSTDLKTANQVDEEPEDDENDTKTSDRSGMIRSLCYRRFSDLVEQYASVFDFVPFIQKIFLASCKSINHLPETAANSDKLPALLSLLVTISAHRNLIPLFRRHDIVKCTVLCLSPRTKGPVMEGVLTFLENLVTIEEETTDILCEFIFGDVGLLLSQFENTLTSNELSFNAKRRILSLLFRLSKLMEKTQSCEHNYNETLRMNQLCSVLLKFIESGKGISDIDRMNVLGVLQIFAPNLSDGDSVIFYYRLSGLLYSSKAEYGLLDKKVKLGIALIIEKIARSGYPSSHSVSQALLELCAIQEKRLDELDYEKVISVLGELSETKTGRKWKGLCCEGEYQEPKVLIPLINLTFSYLFDEEGVVPRGALKALKTLINTAALEGKVGSNEQPSVVCGEWRKLLEGTIVPSIRNGISSRKLSSRRYFILLMGEVSRSCRDSPSPNLHGDLAILINDDEPDLDFFINITHVQIHRRARALQRLRKQLQGNENETEKVSGFSMQSLSTFFLPLVTHPIYESKQKLEEPFTLEAIAAMGAICRHLSWSKYSNVIGTLLNQFARHEEQERYLVGAICSVIDGFHFDILVNEGDDGKNDVVWRGLDKRVIPKIEELLVKVKMDRNETKLNTLRPAIVLALLKMFKKLPRQLFERKIPRLLTIICGALKSRDSDVRESARKTLSKMVVDLDVQFLPDVLKELMVTLTEGYQLHVRAATVHTILLDLSQVISPNKEQPIFDKSVPAIMEIVQQDLFGLAQERKEAELNQVRYVKEAGGSKSLNALELVAKMIVFNPLSFVDSGRDKRMSSIHALVTPFIERLRSSDVSASSIRRIKECLSRIAVGLSSNPTVTIEETLPFIYATLSPFIGQEEVASVVNSIHDETNSDDESPEKTLYISGASTDAKGYQGVKAPGQVVEWVPSARNNLLSTKDAKEVRKLEEAANGRVQDGASAPKLTGSRRRETVPGSQSINNPASISATLFGLQILNSSLKKSFNENPELLQSMLDPFVPLLTTCVCICRESDIVLLAMKALGAMLRIDLPSLSKCAKSLATKTLELLVSAGGASSSDQDLLQSCFKMLTFLFNFDKTAIQNSEFPNQQNVNGKEATYSGKVLPLDAEQMQVLISFLQSSIVQSEQHAPALGLVKVLISRKFVSAEFYDLMETLLEQSVRSAKSNMRQQCTGIFLNYLLNYPMSEERIEEHLNRVILNLKYEHTEGRLSAITLTLKVIEKFPIEALEKHNQLFFLPLTLQLANDDSAECRESLAKALNFLFERVSGDILQSLFEYMERWLSSNGPVRRTSLQLCGILVDSRPEFLKRGKAEKLADTIRLILHESKNEWEVEYFSLVCLEKMHRSFESALVVNYDLWTTIVECLTHDHLWVNLASSRLVSNHFSSLDPTTFGTNASNTFLVERPGSLYQAARNFCFQLNQEETKQNDDLTTLSIKSLTWIIKAMRAFPRLCFKEQPEEERDPVLWVMKRLNNIAKPKGRKRRQAVYKCFAAFGTYCSDIVLDYLELLLEPLYRSEMETRNELEIPSLVSRERAEGDVVTEEAQLAKDVMHLLEERCDLHNKFLEALAAVKSRARDKKEKRKVESKAEALLDPQMAAQRRIQKQEREKQRRKRKVEERRQHRGGTAKRQHLDFDEH